MQSISIHPLICHSYTYAMYSINMYSVKSFQHCSLGEKYAVPRTIFLLASYKNVKSSAIGANDAPGELDKQKHSTPNYCHKSHFLQKLPPFVESGYFPPSRVSEHIGINTVSPFLLSLSLSHICL